MRHEEQAKALATREEFTKLKAFAESFVDRGTIDAFIAENHPKMDECLKRVRLYADDNLQMKAIVQSMDV